MQKDGEEMLTGDKNENTLRQTELLVDKIPKINQEKKSKKKRLHFVCLKKIIKKIHKKVNKDKIEILDFEEQTKYDKKRSNYKLPKLNRRAKSLCGAALAFVFILAIVGSPNFTKTIQTFTRNVLITARKFSKN